MTLVAHLRVCLYVCRYSRCSRMCCSCLCCDRCNASEVESVVVACVGSDLYFSQVVQKQFIYSRIEEEVFIWFITLRAYVQWLFVYTCVGEPSVTDQLRFATLVSLL